MLFHLEIRNAVTQQTAGAAFALININHVTSTGQLLRSGKASRARADDGNRLARLVGGWLRHDMAELIGLVAQCLLDRLDRNRRILEVQRAGFLARGRANATREFREIVGQMQVADRLIPIVVIDEIVPVRDLVMHRTARRAMAERNAAIHAARRLLLHFAIRHRNGEFPEVTDTIRRWLVLRYLPVNFKKTSYLTHSLTPLGLRPARGRLCRKLPCLPHHLPMRWHARALLSLMWLRAPDPKAGFHFSGSCPIQPRHRSAYAPCLPEHGGIRPA